MLSHFSSLLRDCDGVHRRDLLKIGMLGGLGVTLPGLLAAKAQAKGKARKSDVNCILIWTQGGTSHHDTFDPKPEAPQNVRGEYGVIGTAVPGVKFAEILPNMGKELGRYGVLRSWNPHNGSHGTADQYVMSGRSINPALVYPTYGSVVSHQLGFKTRMPPFVQLGRNLDRRFGGGSAGYLGQEHNPFEIAGNPNTENFYVRDISPPPGVDASRLERRRGMLKKIDALQHQADSQPDEFTVMDLHQRAALDLITAPETKSAFDIGVESAKLRDQYGRNTFGQSCLLARRLIESGVRLVTVTDGGWDTHANNFVSLKNNLIPKIDQGLPTLLRDLEARGLLSTTLVVWLTDFGRTPKVNSAGGRDHWSTAGFAIMAGAGVPGGSVLGRTDGEGGRPTHDEYATEDIAATIYTKLGIPLDLITNTPDGRPIRLNEGRLIKEWM